MQIKIENGSVTITGQNGFASVDMSDTKYCPKYDNAKCEANGTINFKMQSNGSVEPTTK